MPAQGRKILKIFSKRGSIFSNFIVITTISLSCPKEL
jgi:hypothetical protein